MIRRSFRLSSASISGQRGSFSSLEHDCPLFPRNHSGTSESSGRTLKSFDEIPGNWRNNWANVYVSWKKNHFKNAHYFMMNNFNKYGPIYRERIGLHNSVFIINPEDAATVFKAEGLFPERLKIKPWVAYRDLRKLSYGVLLKSGEDWKRNRLILNKELMAPDVVQKFVPLLNEVALDFVSMVNRNIEKSRRGYWAADISNDLFKFALESVHYIIHGERLDLLQGRYNHALQTYIDSILRMFKSTAPMLHIPVGLLKSINAKVWQEHVDSWDIIYGHANDSIQRAYRYMYQRLKNDKAYPGILADLLKQDTSFEDITANIMELNAGGVDTTSITLLWTMYSLARYPNIQKNLRSEIMEANQKTGGDPVQMLQLVPLLKGALKETLRLYPVAITLQRYTTEDIALQDYHIPAGMLVQIGIFAMGRSPEIFSDPERYNPERWLKHRETSFKHLGFGFGPRQCIGRRLAETEMSLFLIHMLQNFKIETNHMTEVKANFDLILLPEKPINLVFKAIN